LGTVLNIQFESLVAIRYPIPYTLFGELTTSLLNKVSSHLHLVSNPRRKTVGGDLFIKHSRDYLAPAFVSDSLDSGVFAGQMPLTTRRRAQEHFDSDAGEGDNVSERPELIARTFLNLIGSVTLDAFLTFDAACHTVTRNAQQVQKHFFVEWSRESAWVLRYIEAFHETLANILTATAIPWQRRFALLCFVADLPFEHLHNSIPNIGQDACEKLRRECGTFCDELDDLGLLAERPRGAVSLGALEHDRKSKVPLIFAESKHRFPSIDIGRQTKAVGALLKTIQGLKPSRSWDYRVEPPPHWGKLSEQLKASYRKKNAGKAKAKARAK
jgi:hypothetical protein